MNSTKESLTEETETIDLQSRDSSSYFGDEEAKNSLDFSQTKFHEEQAGN